MTYGDDDDKKSYGDDYDRKSYGDIDDSCNEIVIIPLWTIISVLLFIVSLNLVRSNRM
jgi:hypothetical protein